MLDYNPADLGIEAPEADTTTHVCGCGQYDCPDCNPHPGATAPAWWLAQPQPGEADEETNDLPF